MLGTELRGFRQDKRTSLEEFAHTLNISPLTIIKDIYKKYREPAIVKQYRDNILSQIDECFFI